MLTPLHANILRALARYRFLTNSQFHLLGFGNLQVIRRATHFLTRHPKARPLVLRTAYAPHARLGRMAYMYRISPDGLRTLENLEQRSIALRPIAKLSHLDYFHRHAVITFRILFDRAVVATIKKQVIVERYRNYFEYQSATSPKISATRIDFWDGEFFIPDCLFMVKINGIKRAFALEYVRGRSVARTLAQIQRHIRAVSEGVLKNCTALFLFENHSLETGVLKRLSSQQVPWFSPFAHCFAFATFANIQADVLGRWQIVGNDSPFHLLN